jgi:hypothetical protein
MSDMFFFSLKEAPAQETRRLDGQEGFFQQLVTGNTSLWPQNNLATLTD